MLHQEIHPSCTDETLQQLLLEHVEPKMLELINLTGNSHLPRFRQIRKLKPWENGNTMNRRFYIEVYYAPRTSQYFYLQILRDGKVVY